MLIESDNLSVTESGSMYTLWLCSTSDTVLASQWAIENKGEVIKSKYKLDQNDIATSTSAGITLESGTAPSQPTSAFLLAGAFQDHVAELTVTDASAFSTLFNDVQGTYLTATPTNSAGTTHEYSGLWFVQDITASNSGLSLGNLPNGYVYESWVEISETYVSLGRFSDPNAPDSDSTYNDTINPAFAFPGGDLLTNAPTGLNFPVDLRNSKVLISVENTANMRSQPLLIILEATISPDAIYNNPYSMSQASANYHTLKLSRSKKL